MTLEASRARAEQAFVMREVGMQSWSKIRDALGFRSVGAAQLAVKRYRERNPLPNAEAARAGIVERKRVTLGTALSSLAQAKQAGDHQVVARLIDVITRADAELARLYGLNAPEQVDVTVTTDPRAVIDRLEAELLALVSGRQPQTALGGNVIEAEVIE